VSVASNEFDVRRLTALSPDYLRALHVALQAPWQPSGKPAARVADLISRADGRTASLDPCVAAYRDGQLVSACVALETPGAAALVFAPIAAGGSDADRATIAALEALVEAAWTRSVRLLEILTEPADTASGPVLREAGFRRLTRLLYLVRGDAPALAKVCAADDLRWVAYSPAREQLFCEALEATYVQSLDCPELTGLRSTRDVLAGHRATGIFDPSRWWVVKRGDTLAGVLLLNGIPDRDALEVVYMGVAQASRGTRVADALLQRAVDEMGCANAKQLALAVDERNGPARHLYSRWGFVHSAGRDAWIATPPGT
jgi:mycothiol synthase